MKIAFLLLLFSTSLLAKDGILFKTTSGDFLIELDYKHAPKTSRYFANLASSSLFIGVKLNYLGKRIGLRSEFIEDLPKKTTGNYQDFIQPQEFEKSNLKHIRGAVSLTTNSAKPKGTSSIGLIFNDAPELDGKAIVFGSIVGIQWNYI